MFQHLFSGEVCHLKLYDTICLYYPLLYDTVHCINQPLMQRFQLRRFSILRFCSMIRQIVSIGLRLLHPKFKPIPEAFFQQKKECKSFLSTEAGVKYDSKMVD